MNIFADIHEVISSFGSILELGSCAIENAFEKGLVRLPSFAIFLLWFGPILTSLFSAYSISQVRQSLSKWPIYRNISIS